MTPLLAAALASTMACNDIETVRGNTATLLPEATVATMDGEELRGFLESYNLMPPRSTLTGDFAFIIEEPGSSRRMIALFQNGCLASLFWVSPRYLSSLTKSL